MPEALQLSLSEHAALDALMEFAYMAGMDDGMDGQGDPGEPLPAEGMPGLQMLHKTDLRGLFDAARSAARKAGAGAEGAAGGDDAAAERMNEAAIRAVERAAAESE